MVTRGSEEQTTMNSDDSSISAANEAPQASPSEIKDEVTAPEPKAPAEEKERSADAPECHPPAYEDTEQDKGDTVKKEAKEAKISGHETRSVIIGAFDGNSELIRMLLEKCMKSPQDLAQLNLILQETMEDRKHMLATLVREDEKARSQTLALDAQEKKREDAANKAKLIEMYEKQLNEANANINGLITNKIAYSQMDLMFRVLSDERTRITEKIEQLLVGQ